MTDAMMEKDAPKTEKSTATTVIVTAADATDDEDIDSCPPYYPAIQGCRNVEEFQCINRVEEG